MSQNPVKLPEDWAPTEEQIQRMQDKGLNVEAEVREFRLWADRESMRMYDWHRAFDTWINKGCVPGWVPTKEQVQRMLSLGMSHPLQAEAFRARMSKSSSNEDLSASFDKWIAASVSHMKACRELPDGWAPTNEQVQRIRDNGMGAVTVTNEFRAWVRTTSITPENWTARFDLWIDEFVTGRDEAPAVDTPESDAPSEAEPHPLGEDGEKLFADVWAGLAKIHARENNIPVGKARCPVCGEIRNWGDEPTCDCELDAARREAQEAREHSARQALERVVPHGMRWSRIGQPRWSKIESACPRLAEFTHRWNRDAGSCLILGPTGIGKTAAVAALMHRILSRTTREDVPQRDRLFAYRMRWVDGPGLVVARRNARLGSEADLIEQAKQATLLVIDELGFESKSPTPFEVINARYHEGIPTIITSGLRGKYKDPDGRERHEFRDRYGAAMLRRIQDCGSVIDLWKT
jgi:hypothetical protein